MIISDIAIQAFQREIYNFYNENKRDFSWRSDISPYRVVVSEIMLQQTQTARVVSKFEQWIAKFPDFRTLAEAPVSGVLAYWQGLGYNRRAIALHGIAKKIISEWNGEVPQDPVALQTCKGIGKNTAGSILAFAFNKPTVFIETNIRTVFLHYFFQGKSAIADHEIYNLVERALDKNNPREWYYALMDYGVYLKKVHKASNIQSKHYAKQSRFIGSKRQIRGFIIRLLSKHTSIQVEDLIKQAHIQYPDSRWNLEDIINDLEKESFLKYNKNTTMIMLMD